MRHQVQVRTAEQMTHHLRRLLREVARPRLGSYLSAYHSADLASAFPHLDPEERSILWKSLEPAKAGRVLSQCPEEIQVAFLSEVDPPLVTQIVSQMEPDDAADFVELVPEERRAEILQALSDEVTRKVEQLLNYPPDTAGGLMSTQFISFPEGTTAGEAIRSLRESPPRKIYYNIYVVNKDGVLLGWCTWQQLVLADPQTRLEELIPARCPSVDALTPQEEVARLVAKYDIAAIPVVDIDGKLLGTITNDDVIDVIAEEASEDMMLVAGGSELELHQPSVVKSVVSRMPWLAITFAAGCINAFLMGRLESITVPTNLVAILFYVPMTMAMGGNVGLQTSTMTIRRLVLGETDLGALFMDLWRELRVGLLMGVTFGITVGTVAGYILPSGDPTLGMVVGLALFLAVTASALMGAIVPIAFHKFSVDPAVASSPLVTAVNDLTSLTIYVTIAFLLLNH